MGVGISNAHLLAIDHAHDLIMRSHSHFALRGEEGQDSLPVTKTSERKFPDDGRVAQQGIGFNDRSQFLI